MPFDKDAFAKHLRAHALPPYGKGRCARYVREAMVAGGLNTIGNPFYAKDYGPFLVRLGFQQVSRDKYVPQVGDIVVMPANAHSVGGHVAGWDGRNWISDFVQGAMMPGPDYRKKGEYEVYRAP